MGFEELLEDNFGFKEEMVRYNCDLAIMIVDIPLYDAHTIAPCNNCLSTSVNVNYKLKILNHFIY